MIVSKDSTPEQKEALRQALRQHSLQMAVRGDTQESEPPSYSEKTRQLYDGQLFPQIVSADDLIANGYATPDGQPTEQGKMAISLKKVGALNDDYTLNNTGRAMLSSKEDLLDEKNIDLYREYKSLELDESSDIGIWDGIKNLAATVINGANSIAENELDIIKNAASSKVFGGAFTPYGAEKLTPEKQAENLIELEEAAKDVAISTATIAKGLVTAEDKLWARVFNEGTMQDYQVAYLDQKFDRDMYNMEKVQTSEVADELAKVIGLETQFAEERQQAEKLIGPEATQEAIARGRSMGTTISLVNPLAPEAVVARVGFGAARTGIAQAFKPISRKLLESEAKAARALEAGQRVTGLNSHLAQTKYLAQKAEQEALFAERQADKYSRLGLPERANATRKFADNLRTKGLEATAKAQGLTDEIARASDEAAKLAQDAAVADKINFIAQKARALPGLPIQAVGGIVEGVGRAMIGIDKGLATLASKVGADKAWNAMNKISSLSGLGGAGAAMGLGPVAFVPAAVRTAWSTAPFLKGAGHFIRMIGKETANARGQIPFWQRVANYETLGAVPRAVAHLMDTSTLGSRVTGFAGDVTKGMAASYPVDLAFQWISEGGEMDMNTLKQAAAETVVFGGTGAALGGITAGSQERIKKLQRGDAMNFYRNLKDGSQRVAFNALNDGMKRSIGTYSASFPNLNIRFIDQGGGAFDPASNTAFINPMSRNPLKPLLAHEINHYILVRNQMEGGIAAALVGDGVQTGGILRGKDGKLDENFQAFKEEYTRRLEAQHNRRINEKIAAGDKVTAKERSFIAPTDNDIAIEYFVDSMADDMMGMAETGELGKKAGRMLVTRKMQAFGNAILQQAPIIKDFFYKLGGATDKAGRAVYGNGLLAEGIREIPEMKKLFRKMISESAGRPMHVAKVTKGESEGHNIPIMGKDDPILDEMTSMFESDENGVPLRDKNGDRILLSDATEQLRSTSGLMLMEDQQNRINRGETLEPGELRFNPEENAWTGEYLTDRQIQLLRASGRFNKAQIRQLEMLNGAARENTGRRFLVFNQPATKKRKRKGGLDYATLGVSMREIVPYGIKITKDGNILVRLMSVQQLHANAFEKATSKRGQSLYKGDAEAILNDVNQVIENHGRNEPTDAYFKSKYGTEWEVRKNFINTVFGNVGKGQKDINPLLAAEKAKNAVVKTYRIDRINKATELEGRTMLPYQNHLVKVNFMPEGEPILDANGEPKDLRYTPSMPEAQRAMPEGEQKPTRFMPEKLDADYMKAVESGDVEAQQRMVDDAAQAAGYGSPTLYRGDRPNKTKFTGREDPSISIQGNIFLFEDPKQAKFYTNQRTNYMRKPESMGISEGLYSLKANLGGKVLNIDAKDNDWTQIPAPKIFGGEREYPYGIQIDDLAQLAKTRGYTALTVKNVGDQSGWGTQYIVFNPNQIKSADPVTYDDSGKVIPLSKRFDIGSKDIRFMPEASDVSPEDLNPVENMQEAQGLWSDGKRLFAMNEMEETVTPITSKAMLDAYTADQIGWMEPTAQSEMRFMPEGASKTIDSNIPDKEGGKMKPSTWDSLSKAGYSPEASEKTQIATTAPTYESIVKANAVSGMEVLDFSAGRGIGTKAMKAIGKNVGFNVEGYEPFSNEKTRVIAPEYEGEDAINDIADNSKDIIINNAVLNVVPEATGRQIVNQIYSKLKPGGSAFINVMGWNNIKNRLDNPKTKLVGPREVITQKGTFQKGYTTQSLKTLIEQELPDAKIVRTSHGDIGFKVTKPAPPAETMPAISQPEKTGNLRFLPEPVEKLSAFKGKRVQVLTSDLSLVGDVQYGDYTASFKGGPGYLDNDGWAFTDKAAADAFVTRWKKDGEPLIGLASLGSANHLNSLDARKAYAEKWKYLVSTGEINEEIANSHIKKAMKRIVDSNSKNVKPDWRNAAKMIENVDDLSNYLNKIPWAAAPMFYSKLTAKTLPIKYKQLVELGLDLESVAKEYRQPEFEGAELGDLYAIAEYDGSTPDYKPELNKAYPWRIKFKRKATLSEMHNVAKLTTDPRAFAKKKVGGRLGAQPLMVTGINLDKLMTGDIAGSSKPLVLREGTKKTKSNTAKQFGSGNPESYRSYQQIQAERNAKKPKKRSASKGNASAIAKAAKLK